jgi:hypothetical protein
MGDVIDFRQKPPKPPINNKKLDFKAFLDYYEANIDKVNSLANFLVLNTAKELDIGKLEEYDVFMLREAIMSLAMRSRGLYHPLQEMTDEYIVFFGGKPPPEEDS